MTADTMIGTLAAVTVYGLAVALIYKLTVWLWRALSCARNSPGCRLCAYLGQLPAGLPYWYLRRHLARAGRRIRENDREPMA